MWFIEPQGVVRQDRLPNITEESREVEKEYGTQTRGHYKNDVLGTENKSCACDLCNPYCSFLRESTPPLLPWTCLKMLPYLPHLQGLVIRVSLLALFDSFGLRWPARLLNAAMVSSRHHTPKFRKTVFCTHRTLDGRADQVVLLGGLEKTEETLWVTAKTSLVLLKEFFSQWTGHSQKVRKQPYTATLNTLPWESAPMNTMGLTSE